MTNLLQNYEKDQINKLTSKKRIPAFRPGDTVKVTLKIMKVINHAYKLLKACVYQEKIIQLTLSLLLEKCLMVKV